jgi:hypothetical protein
MVGDKDRKIVGIDLSGNYVTVEISTNVDKLFYLK